MSIPAIPQRTVSSLAWLTAPLWLLPLAWWLAYHPWPLLSYAGLLILYTAPLMLIGALVASSVVLVGPLLGFSRKYRRAAWLAVGQAVVFCIAFLAGMTLGGFVRLDRVNRITAAAGPLVQAIQTFHETQGRPPTTLDELFPGHIPAVPSTGVGMSPTFRYVEGEPEAYDGNPWVLIIYPPCPLGFDSLLYFPHQNYPARGYGGSLQRVRTWAYVHE
jgi:hypothetical protein